jgi:hypothetical protein
MIEPLDRVTMRVSARMARAILAKAWHFGPGVADVLGEWCV